MGLANGTGARTPAVYLCTLAMLGLSAAACASSVPPSAPQAEVYVLNYYGAERGRADQRPADLVLSEFTTLNAVTWRSWGPTRAVGAGRLSGMWCLPACADAPYDATVTLSDVIPVRGKGYFTRYRIVADLPPEQRARADLSGAIRTP